ncbi:MAG: sel1 repeat family protein [Bacteroidales bacterium]|nr:sel1 repeat family protein [Bacteroidales bacterium]
MDNSEYNEVNVAELIATGDSFGKKGDIPQALEYYMQAAEYNDAVAQYKIGSILMKYPTFETDLEKNHVYWLKLSAEQGNPNALYKLGVCYEGNDIILEEDKNLALEYFEKAASANQALAQSKLGYYYKRGVVVKKDYDMSAYWYQKGAENGHSIAQNQLAFCYMKGEGVLQDLEQAAYWFKKAAAQKHYVSQYQLGLCYMYGKGVEVDYNKAREMFEKAVDNGYEPAQKQLDVLTRLETLNGNSSADKLKEDLGEGFKGINISDDFDLRDYTHDYKTEDKPLFNTFQTAQTEEQTVKYSGNTDIDSLSEREAINLLYELSKKIHADVINKANCEMRLAEIDKEEKLKNAEQLLAQKGFTAEQLELLKNYFNKE